MIIPNLMVTDMARSIAFYRDRIGLSVMVMIDAHQGVLQAGQEDRAVFATLERDGAQLMLQTNESLASELDGFRPDQVPTPAGTVYLRGLDPLALENRVAPEAVVKGPVKQWYGMLELYVRDPDGHILCAGVPEGAPPSGP